MNVNGTRRIASPRERVWQALHDPSVLAACLPGAQDLHLVDAGEYQGRLTGQVGTIASSFACHASVSEERYPAAWSVTAHAQSETVGWFDGVATVTLADESATTVLGYRARVEAGGRLATLGERLLHGTAVRLADDFLDRLALRLEEETRIGRAESRPPPPPPPPPPAAGVRPTAPPPLPDQPPEPAPQLSRTGGTTVVVVGFVLWLMVLLLLFASGH